VLIKTNRANKTEIKKKFKKSAATSRGGPGPFQGPSSSPQLCWWPLIVPYRQFDIDIHRPHFFPWTDT